MCADEIVYGNSYILKRHECCEFSLFHLYIDTWIYKGIGFAAVCNFASNFYCILQFQQRHKWMLFMSLISESI